MAIEAHFSIWFLSVWRSVEHVDMTDKEVPMRTGRSGLKETHENARFIVQHWRLSSISHSGNSLLGSLGGHFHISRPFRSGHQRWVG